jgi:AcrR family transcriptional regulator
LWYATAFHFIVLKWLRNGEPGALRPTIMAISAMRWCGRRGRFSSTRAWRRCRCGVSPAAPYHHFPDKQALRDAVAEQGFEALTLAMTTRMGNKKDPQARLEASGVGYITFAVENPALFALMFGAGQQLSANAAVVQAGQRAYAVLAAAAAATSPDGAADPLVCLRLWGLVHGVAKLILEGCVNPADYGVSGGEALAVRLLRGA